MGIIEDGLLVRKRYEKKQMFCRVGGVSEEVKK